ncbi:MAG: hypothetical protein E7672_03270 [Ruminococcaceae bacterium]|nr:hypothetical protein [Oscillospiraceae bacterium]
MNSTQQLSDKKYSSRTYFNFVLKQNWQNLALFIIIVILAMILPTFMFLEDLVRAEEMGFSSAHTILDEVEDIARNISFIGVLVSCAFAVIAGMGALSYVNSERNVGCYHSFPMKRETMFFSETLTRLIYYFVSIILGYTVSYFMVYAMYPQMSVYTVSYINVGLVGVILFILIFSVMMFSAGLTGSAVMRLLMTLVIFFLPIALYYLVVYSVLMNSSLEESYYLNETVAQFLCPIFDIAVKSNFIDKTGIVPILVYIPVAAVYYFGAMLLHKFRKSESSGTTIIWKPVFAVVKYLLIFSAGLLGVIIFGSGIFDGSEFTAYIIGALMGLVISFIVVNCILYRSSKSMFKGLKTFIVFAVCFAVFMVLFVFNAYGIVGKPYSPEATKKIELIADGNHITIEDNDTIGLIVDYINGDSERGMEYSEGYILPYIYSEENDDLIEQYYPNYSKTVFERENGPIQYENGKYVYESGMEFPTVYVDDLSTRISVRVLQVPVFGIPLFCTVRINTAGEMWGAITETEGYEAALDLASWMKPERVDNIDITLGGGHVYVYNHGSDYVKYSTGYQIPYYDVTVEEEYLNIEVSVSNGKDEISELLSMFDYSRERAKNSTLIGHARVSYNHSLDEVMYPGYTAITYPIYAEDIELINYVMTTIIKAYDHSGSDKLIRRNDYTSAADYIADQISGYAPAFLVDMKTGEAVMLDQSDLAGLIEKTSMMPEINRYYVRSVLGKESSDYALVMSGTESRNYHGSSWHLFREGAAEKSELDEIFLSSGKQP